MTARDERACAQKAQAVGWTLHALEPDEDVALEQHARRCRSCRAAIRDTESVMARLAFSIPQIDPPPWLRRAILARAADDAGRQPAQRGGRHPRRRLVAAVAAGMIAFGGLAAYTAQVQAQRDDQITQSRALADVVVDLGSPGTAHATLATPGGDPIGAVLVEGGVRTVVTAGLAPNDRENTVYVVWGFTDGGPRPIGTFDVTASQIEVYLVPEGVPSSAIAGYAISLENGRVAPSSPGTVVASGPIKT